MVEWKTRAITAAEYELYDYETDPLETKNLAAKHADVLGKLKAILAKYPEPVSRTPRKKTTDVTTPPIANREITVSATVRAAAEPAGVVLAQGGRVHGYALHFVQGLPTWDVRLDGNVTRLQAAEKVHGGKTTLQARITAAELSLTVGGQTTTAKSPGLIPLQPVDELSIGEDTQSAAGDYAAPNPFNGKVLAHEVLTVAANGPPPLASLQSRPGRWSSEQAWAWYDQTAWPVGANFVPSGAINQLEMWQADTFDPDTNWGLVDGKTQTKFPWDSWQNAYTQQPNPWHHDIFHEGGAPYSQIEVCLINQLTKQPPTRPSRPPKVATPPSRAVLQAGLKSHDRALFVKSGWIRDPYIAIGPDGDYYLTGTTPLPDDPRQQDDPYNTGLGPLSLVGWKAQVWRSKDLIDWELLGTPFTLKDGVWFDADRDAFDQTPVSQWRLWAPELHWLGDRWALVHTSPSPVKGANLSLTHGRDVAGPWSNPMGPQIARRHDPSLFQDGDGTWWMIWGATEIAPLKPDFSGFASKPITIGPSGETKKMGHEGCLMHKIGDKYVLFGTGWSTGKGRRGSYNLYYATADKITGPYSERKFAGRFLGHGTPFQDKQGRWWCTGFFNANVPPLETTAIQTRDLSHDAQTINQQGVTLVPMEVGSDDDGVPIIRAKDPNYAIPGPDEAQNFGT